MAISVLSFPCPKFEISNLKSQIPPISVSVANEQRILRIDRRFIRRVVERTLLAENVASAEISVALVDDARSHETNREFLGHDYATDVISFLLECESPRERSPAFSKSRASESPRGAGISLVGELVVSTETAVTNAAQYGWNPRDELTLYLVHGLLHLCGYDDQSRKEQRLMRARETEILAQWKLVPHYTTRL